MQHPLGHSDGSNQCLQSEMYWMLGS